jgi:hypothetical protein
MIAFQIAMAGLLLAAGYLLVRLGQFWAGRAQRAARYASAGLTPTAAVDWLAAGPRVLAYRVLTGWAVAVSLPLSLNLGEGGWLVVWNATGQAGSMEVGRAPFLFAMLMVMIVVGVGIIALALWLYFSRAHIGTSPEGLRALRRALSGQPW